MPDIASIVALALGLLAVLIAVVGVLRTRTAAGALSRENAAELFRNEHDRLRAFVDEQFRGVRSELGVGMRGLQESSVRSFGELGKALETQIVTIGERMEGSVGRIEKQSQTVAEKLDTEFQKLAAEATQNRDRLRVAIEERLDKAAAAQAEATLQSRTTLLQSIQDQGKAATDLVGQIGEHQKERLNQFGVALAKLAAEAAESRETFRATVEERLDKSTVAQSAAALETRTALLTGIQDQGKVVTDLLNQIGAHLKEGIAKSTLAQAEAAVEARAVLLQGIQDAGKAATELLGQISEHQKERLEKVSSALAELTLQQGEKLEAVRATVEQRLDVLRADNSQKLEEMRQTVDEKLKGTLEQRLGESFNRVVEQLERVHAGIGEMKTLANGVGDLKKVLSNVSVRGALGEIQLARLLEQLLSPEQFIENASVRENSRERVEFAIRLPGRDGESEVLLPIDAKFPQEDYQRLLEAGERADVDGMAQAGQALEQRIRQFARTIREKYIAPPRTTDFAVLFLHTEGLYAEVLRRPGLFDDLQRQHHVTLAGPTTLTAFLNALQMGFRSVAIEKRSSEVWQVLGAVRGEFEKYNAAVEGLGKHLGTAANSVAELARRTRVMHRKLKNVETLPAPEAAALLGLDDSQQPADEVDESDAS